METTNYRYVSTGELCDVVTPEEGLVIELFRSGRYTGPRDGLNGFRPAKIVKGGATVWSFQDCGADTQLGQFAELYECDDGEILIAIRDKLTIFAVVRPKDFAHSVPVRIGSMIVTMGGSSLEELFDLKTEIARCAELECWHSPEEKDLLQQRLTAQRAVRREEADRLEQEKQARLAEREAFIAEILNRKTVKAWSSDGKQLYGIPVTTDAEWMCLPDKKYCVLMKDGNPVEAFQVSKVHSKVKKGCCVAVSKEQPSLKKDTASEIPTALEKRNVTIRGETRTIMIFESMDVVKSLQRSGLNSGTWVGVLPTESDTLAVYAVTSSNIQTVGHLKRKQQTPA